MSNLLNQTPYQKGQKPGKSKVVRNSARDETCKLRIPGVCTGYVETTVNCHLRLFGLTGGGQQPDDILIVEGCTACHRVLDSRDKWPDAQLGWDDVLRALMQTLLNRRASGLIILKGE